MVLSVLSMYLGASPYDCGSAVWSLTPVSQGSSGLTLPLHLQQPPELPGWPTGSLPPQL